MQQTISQLEKKKKYTLLKQTDGYQYLKMFIQYLAGKRGYFKCTWGKFDSIMASSVRYWTQSNVLMPTSSYYRNYYEEHLNIFNHKNTQMTNDENKNRIIDSRDVYKKISNEILDVTDWLNQSKV